MIKQWISNHPVVFGIFTAVISAMATMDIIFLASHQPVEWDLWMVQALMLVAMGACVVGMSYKAVKVVLVTLAIAAALPAKAQEPLPLVIIGGGIIIVGGGWIGWRAAKKCKKIAKARTNAWPEEAFSPAGSYEYAGYFTTGEASYCIAERIDIEPTVFTLTISVAEQPTTTMTAEKGWSNTIGWDQFTDESASHGINIPDAQSPQRLYARNGHPCYEEDSILRFQSGVLTVDGGGILTTVERSQDLKEWEPLVTLNTRTGSNLRIEDVSHGQMFYRIQTSKP